MRSGGGPNANIFSTISLAKRRSPKKNHKGVTERVRFNVEFPMMRGKVLFCWTKKNHSEGNGSDSVESLAIPPRGQNCDFIGSVCVIGFRKKKSVRHRCLAYVCITRGLLHETRFFSILFHHPPVRINGETRVCFTLVGLAVALWMERVYVIFNSVVVKCFLVSKIW